MNSSQTQTTTSPFYRPTPLERAYFSYLLATFFGTPFDATTQTPNNDHIESIRVPGRSLVPFLTTSGVERSLLRLLWTVADPDGVGTLTTRSQFYCLLRLVAMAQAHFLPPLPPSGEDAEKLNVLKETLIKNARLVVALPTFTADSNCPTVAYMMGTYPPVTAASSEESSAPMVFGGGLSDDFTINAGAGGGMHGSVSDAFGSMGEVEDRPLAPLQPTPQPTPTVVAEDMKMLEEQQPTLISDDGQMEGDEGFGNFDSASLEHHPQQPATTMGGDDDFGNFDSVPATAQQQQTPMGDAMDNSDDVGAMSGSFGDENQQATGANNDFGNFDSVPVPQQPMGERMGGSGGFGGSTDTDNDDFGNFDSVPASAPPAGHIDEDPISVFEEDDFGDFAGSSTHGSEVVDTGSTDIKTESSATNNYEEMEVNVNGEEDDSFGAFGDFDAAAPPAAEDEVSQPTPTEGFGTMAGLPPMGASDSGPTLSISDAFDSMIEQDTTTTGMEEINAVTGTEEDNFGDFEGGQTNENEIDTHTAEDGADFGHFDGPGQSSEMETDNDFGGIEGTDQQAAAVDGGFGSFGSSQVATSNELESGNKLSVFDALVDVQDAPLPSLGAFSAGGTNKPETEETEAAAEDDDFGDFSGQEHAGDIGETNTQIDESEEDGFGDFTGEEPVEDNVLAQNQVVAENDGVGDFGSAMGSGDAKSMAEIESELKATTAVDSDGFGDFDSGISSSDHSGTNQVAQDASFAGNSDLADTDTSPVMEADDKFGGFTYTDQTSVAESTTTTIADGDCTAPGSSSKLSAFDAFGAVEDTPLPPLGTLSSVNELATAVEDNSQVDSNEDSFGDFATPSEERGSLVDDGEDEPSNENFGDFEGSGNKEMNIESEANDDNGFGDFGSGQFSSKNETNEQLSSSEYLPGGSVCIADENKINSSGALSAFDALADVPDAPLPPLGSFASSNGLAETEDMGESESFGDFGDPVDVEDKSGAVNDVQVDACVESTLATDSLFDGSAMDDVANEPGHQGNDMDIGTGDIAGGNTLSSVFDAFGEVQDAPLPSLEAFSPAGEMSSTEDVVGADPGVGDFEGIQDTDVQATAETIVKTDGPQTFDTFIQNAPSMPVLETLGENAGEPQALDQTAEDDGFGDFGDFSGPGETTAGIEVAEKLGNAEDDGFGDFGDSVLETLGENAGEPQALDQTAEDDGFGDFGDFSGPGETTAGIEVAEKLGNAEDDGFGDFGDSVLETLGENAGEPQALDQTAEDDGFGDFGDFSGPGETTAGIEVAEKLGNAEDDGFGDFGDFASPDENLVDATTANAEEESHADAIGSVGASQGQFGDFEAQVAPEESAVGGIASANDNVNMFDAMNIPPPPLGGPDSNDMFDGFGGAAQTSDEPDDFGDFEGLPAAADGEEAFGNIEGEVGPAAFPDEAPPVDNGLPETDDTDDFGDFEAFQATDNEAGQIQGQDEGLCQFDAVPPSADGKGEGFTDFEAHASAEPSNDNFGGFDESSNVQSSSEGFGDFPSFENSPPQPEQEKKGDLEGILRANLGNDRLPSHWKNVIISTVESDLQRGNRIMDYLASEKNLTSKDKSAIVKSKKLREHILGLAEFVRVVRYITATIGQLLDVDRGINVQESTLSQWKNNELIADVIVIEYIWSEIVSKSLSLGVISDVPQLESVVEIRSRATSFDAQKDTLCQLTLQPLAGRSLTGSSVEWKGKKYLACAANFCANRVPEHVM